MVGALTSDHPGVVRSLPGDLSFSDTAVPWRPSSTTAPSFSCCEGHTAIGTTSTAQRWAIARGESEGRDTGLPAAFSASPAAELRSI